MLTSTTSVGIKISDFFFISPLNFWKGFYLPGSTADLIVLGMRLQWKGM